MDDPRLPQQRRAPRHWARVELASHVARCDILSFKALDGHWREAKVYGVARNLGMSDTWWAVLRLWADNAVTSTVVLVQRSTTGALFEIDSTGLPAPRALDRMVRAATV